MIDFRRNITYCKQLDKVENFEEAVHDMNNTWILHHKFETKCPLYKPSYKELIDWGLYYDRPPEEFIYMKKSDHCRLHNSCGNYGFQSGMTPWNKGKPFSEETKKKISENTSKAQLGKPHPHKGHPITEEIREKLSKANTGKKHNITDEAKKRMCYGNAKNTHWYNNGIINKRCFECPTGFKEGRV